MARHRRRLAALRSHCATGEPAAASSGSDGPSGEWPPALPATPPWPAAEGRRDGKEYDDNVNYFEAQLPRFELPPLLVGNDGTQIATAEQWRTRRRPELMGQLASLLYGSVPTPPSPLTIGFEVVATDSGFMGGQATRKDVRITIANEQGEASMHILVFAPSSASPDSPAPAFLQQSFDDTQSHGFDASESQPGRLKNGIPLASLLSRGFGFVAVYQQDL